MKGLEKSLVLDTETTGLGAYDEVVEIAIIRADDGRALYDAVVMPDGKIPVGASAVHGLDRNRLHAMSAERWPVHHAPVSRILATASVVYSYNAEFDQRMLDQTARRYGLEMPNSRWRCIMLAYARGRRRIRLSEACWHEGIPVSRVHRALADARMARELLLRIEAR